VGFGSDGTVRSDDFVLVLPNKKIDGIALAICALFLIFY
jgi:hypothetical protein